MIKADPETSELKLICPGITPTFVTKAASGQNEPHRRLRLNLTVLTGWLSVEVLLNNLIPEKQWI